ncbi:MAG: cob(I)yrinic acid a,c-diamide adenosyltransferase [Leptospira sp.]|nr:cob(I)yrinic acid a,c-diamide adenosyltransferase [Leptospira sp.]
MKIYTKAGDAGETYLASGTKVTKTDPRVALYGTCDELNSVIGFAISFSSVNEETFTNFLSHTQNLLFEIGSELAGYIPKDRESTCLFASDITDIENEIDRLTESLSPLRSFILPRGSSFAAGLHMARTVCRRLERDVLVYVESGGAISMEIRTYLNRLSDYFFTAARYANFLVSHKESEWKSRTKKQ